MYLQHPTFLAPAILLFTLSLDVALYMHVAVWYRVRDNERRRGKSLCAQGTPPLYSTSYKTTFSLSMILRENRRGE